MVILCRALQLSISAGLRCKAVHVTGQLTDAARPPTPHGSAAAIHPPIILRRIPINFFFNFFINAQAICRRCGISCRFFQRASTYLAAERSRLDHMKADLEGQVAALRRAVPTHTISLGHLFVSNLDCRRVRADRPRSTRTSTTTTIASRSRPHRASRPASRPASRCSSFQKRYAPSLSLSPIRSSIRPSLPGALTVLQTFPCESLHSSAI